MAEAPDMSCLSALVALLFVCFLEPFVRANWAESGWVVDPASINIFYKKFRAHHHANRALAGLGRSRVGHATCAAAKFVLTFDE